MPTLHSALPWKVLGYPQRDPRTSPLTSMGVLSFPRSGLSLGCRVRECLPCEPCRVIRVVTQCQNGEMTPSHMHANTRGQDHAHAKLSCPNEGSQASCCG